MGDGASQTPVVRRRMASRVGSGVVGGLVGTLGSSLDEDTDDLADRLGRRAEPADRRPWYSLDVNRPDLDAYKIVLHRQDDGSWVAEVPAISGCYALMATREEALAELGHVFDMIAEEYQERGAPLPEDTTAIVNA